MDNRDAGEKRQSMVVEGHKLDIVATRIFDDEWSLFIENSQGIRTEWCDFYESADDALKAGRQALETEPLQEFISGEGFGYLP